jgi:iron complex outermembrane recepter protein
MLTLFSQNDSINSEETLPVIEVTINRSVLKTSALSASSHDLTKLITPAYSINELTNRIAGLFTTSSNNFAQDSRISSRGFGARSAFGIRGIRIITDDFPDTSPDGQSQLDNIDFSSLKKIEFLRGPQSGLYGNNSGGVLHLKSFDFFEENNINASFLYGSYGLKTGKLGLVFGNKKFKSNTGIIHTNYDGYRTWSQFQNTVFNSINEYRNGHHKIKALINYANSPTGNDPGGVNLTELGNGSNLARPANELFQAGEKVKQIKAGIKYTYANNEGFEKISFRAYGIQRNFINALPFENNGSVTIDRNLYGINLDYNLKHQWNKIVLGQKIGIEIESQNDLRKQFQNLKTSRGDEKFNQNEIFKSQSIYLLNDLKLNDRLSFTINLRHDQIKTEAKDNFLTNGDQSGNANNNALNYTLAVNYTDELHRYSLINSTGFENPTLSELSNNPAGLGGFSNNLSPMKSSNFELSIQSKNKKKWSYTLNAYRITTTNEIIGYEIAGQTGRTFFRNKGNTTRNGIELSSTLMINDIISLSYQHNFIVAKFSDSTSFVGKSLAGIPKNIMQLGLDVDLGYNTLLQLDNRNIGSIFLNDSNSDKISSYNELNLKVRKEFILQSTKVTIQGGINNLLNADYYSNIRINAAAGRYYESAMPRNFFIGVLLKI